MGKKEKFAKVKNNWHIQQEKRSKSKGDGNLEEFIYRYFIYLIDIVKVTMLYKSLLGKGSRNKRLWFFVMPVLFIITYIHSLISGEKYILFFYVAMITLCILFIINDTLRNKVIYSLLFIFICSYLDSIFAMMVQMASYVSGGNMNVNLSFKFLNIVCGTITIVVIVVFGILRKKLNIITLDKCGFLFISIMVFFLIFDMSVLSLIFNDIYLSFHNENMLSLLYFSLAFSIKSFAEIILVLHLGTAKNYYKEKTVLGAYYLNLQKNHYAYLAEKEKKTKKFRHDLKSHLIAIDTYAGLKDYKNIRLYINKIVHYIGETENIKFTNNEIVDAIINKFHSEAVKRKIKFNVLGYLPNKEDGFDAFDLCIVFSNILSNAFESVEDMDEKFVALSVHYEGDVLCIKSINGYKNALERKNMFFTTKKIDKQEHGIGLENIHEVVTKYDGNIDINIDNNQYTIVILLHYPAYKA